MVADFNADGKLDLGFVNTGSGKISILPGKGDGDFLAAIDATLGGTLTRMTAADLTGDGKVDLAVLSTSEDRVLVLPGNGNGTFGPARKHYAGEGTDRCCRRGFQRRRADGPCGVVDCRHLV